MELTEEEVNMLAAILMRLLRIAQDKNPSPTE